MMDECSFCSRELLGLFLETPLLRFGEFDWVTDGQAPPENFWDACLDCAAEIKELADEMQPVEDFEYPASGEFDIEGVEACSLCRGSLSTSYGHFSIIGEPAIEANHYIFCRNCYTVVDRFLESVPETAPSSSIYAGPADLGWRGHYYVLNEVKYTRALRQHSHIARGLENVRAGDRRLHHHMFDSVLKKIAQNCGRDGTAWVELHFANGGVPLDFSTKVFRSAPYDPDTLLEERDLTTSVLDTPVLVYVPRLGRYGPTRLASAIEPTLEETEAKLRQTVLDFEAKVDAIADDLHWNETAVWEEIGRLGIHKLIQEHRDHALEDPRSWTENSSVDFVC